MLKTKTQFMLVHLNKQFLLLHIDVIQHIDSICWTLLPYHNQDTKNSVENILCKPIVGILLKVNEGQSQSILLDVLRAGQYAVLSCDTYH